MFVQRIRTAAKVRHTGPSPSYGGAVVSVTLTSTYCSDSEPKMLLLKIF